VNSVFAVLGFAGVINGQRELVTGFFVYNAVQMVCPPSPLQSGQAQHWQHGCYSLVAYLRLFLVLHRPCSGEVRASFYARVHLLCAALLSQVVAFAYFVGTETWQPKAPIASLSFSSCRAAGCDIIAAHNYSFKCQWSLQTSAQMLAFGIGDCRQA
jgi:hypothetical protein